MTDSGVTRKLAAIFYADVAGYSRLTGADEEGTHARVSSHLDTMAARITEAGGQVLHYAGDAVLAEFASAVVAVECAVAVQQELAARDAEVPEESKVRFRVGINIGDVIVDRGELFGDGVNVAARLESLAEPGGVCISAAVHEQVAGKRDLAFTDMGAQQVKNIARPIRAYAVGPGAPEAPSGSALDNLSQDIRFCTAADGAQLAYSAVGDGPPLVKTANWLNHLEYDWESPVWRHGVHAQAADNTLIRYDQRGTGLSEWQVEDISFEAWLMDMEAVVDAAGLERFAIFGVSQGCSLAVAYAARHPERVSKLVLYGGYLRGRNHRGAPEQLTQDEAMIDLIKVGWGQQNPAFRQVFTQLLVPDGTPEQMDWYNELQLRTTTPENAVRIREVQNEINVDDLAPQVQAQTLVVHIRDDAVVPFDEGRRMAARIPGARLVALEGRNHLILESDASWPRWRDTVTAFLRGEA